jgi:glycine/serine hydroxymethyltransferase
MKEKEMVQVAEWMDKAIKSRKDDKILNKLSIEIKEFAKKFPLPSDKN